MAEEQEGLQAQEPEGQQPQGEPEGTDWKAEARKWEARAKKSQAAEAELEALKQAQMTEQEKANARAEKAEAEVAALKAEAERQASIAEVAEREGVPAELLGFCSDAEAMEAFAAAYKANKPQVHAAARSEGSRIVKEGGKLEPRDLFAQFAAEQFR